jgi:TonB family protein
MHRTILALTLVSLAPLALSAQDRIIRPGGASSAALHARRCEQSTIEMIEARAAPTDSSIRVPHGYLDQVAREIFFYFNPPEVRTPRFAVVRATAHRDGRLSAVTVVETSNDYFVREIERALGEVATARALPPLPEAVPGDSLALELSFGRHAGGTTPYLAKRKVCPAWPLTSNPTPEYPTELQEQGVRGFVRARFMVDSTGHVDPATFQVLQSSAPAFTEAVRRVLERLRYQPAEVQGRKVQQLTEQTFTFGLTERPPIP